MIHNFCDRCARPYTTAVHAPLCQPCHIANDLAETRCWWPRPTTTAELAVAARYAHRALKAIA